MMITYYQTVSRIVCTVGGAILLLVMLAACQQLDAKNMAEVGDQSTLEIATFAGGCFWCTEADFDKVPGVVITTSGYIGGAEINPTYQQVSAGATSHIEAVQVHFDPTKTSFSKLLTAFWPTIDPLTPNRQFCDSGPHYRSAIFYHDADQQQKAEASKEAIAASGQFTQPIVTELLPATAFYPAEEYHQDYYIKNPIRYTYYRSRCGRDQRLEKVWGKKQ